MWQTGVFLYEPRIDAYLIQSIVNIWGGKIKAVINLDDAETQIDTVLKELNDYINAGIIIPEYDVSEHIKAIPYKCHNPHYTTGAE